MPKQKPVRPAGLAPFCLAASLVFSGCGPASGPASQAGGSPAPADTQTQTIAKDAYVYAYPMVDGYRILHTYFVNQKSPEYKGVWNQVHNIARVYTPDDKAVQAPNSDTPYSMVGLDLRAEPLVLTVPPIEKGRYFSVQLVDLYTHNFDYVGSRTAGNDGGNFLIAGPGWKGETPKGITRVIAAETELVLAIIRTQLFQPSDLDKVKQIQKGYSLKPLSAFLVQPAPAAAAAIDFPTPPTPQEIQSSLRVLELLNFLKKFCPTHPSETELYARFARIGLGDGGTFNASALPAATRAAIEQGIRDAGADLAALQKRISAGEITSGDLFGSRQQLNNNYLYRMGGAKLGIYGNSKQEAMYPAYLVDASGEKLNGANRYMVRFPPGQFPPAEAFWSLTMYGLPESLLVPNPLKRYLINSPMLPRLKKDADGGLTLYVQSDSPGAALESNWLPAPKGPFLAVLRIYWPKQEAIEGRWKQPPMQKVQ